VDSVNETPVIVAPVGEIHQPIEATPAPVPAPAPVDPSLAQGIMASLSHDDTIDLSHFVGAPAIHDATPTPAPAPLVDSMHHDVSPIFDPVSTHFIQHHDGLMM